MNDFFECKDLVFTRDALLTCLYKSKKLDKYINKFSESREMREELKSELFLSLCEIDESELGRIYENNYLDYYIVRTIGNMFNSNTSQFYKRIKKGILNRQHSEPTLNTEIADIEYDENALTEDGIKIGMAALNWFERDVLIRYSEAETISEIVRTTGTSRDYVTKVLDKARKKFRNALY
jgi:hypothetical protein